MKQPHQLQSEADDRFKPDQHIQVEPSPRRVRVVYGGQTIADSKRVLLLRENGHVPVYYFPPSDVRTELLVPMKHQTHCPYKGDASYFTIKVGDRVSENAVWSYLEPNPARLDIKGYYAFYWNKVDSWFEEEEEIFVHPRDPYKRVDAIQSSRHVQVILGGQLIADTRRPVLVFETGMPTRYYFPKEDVRMDLLDPTETSTRCPYKGIASYWSVKTPDNVYKDIVWSYVNPLPEIPKIAGLFSFYNERVDTIYVEGERLVETLE